MARLRTASETVLYIHPRTQKSACFQASSEREVEAVARWCSSPNFPQVAWNAVDHLVKFEGFNSRVMGTWSLMLMVAKGQITRAAWLVRAPVVADEASDSVPMGRGREGGTQRVGLKEEIARLDRDQDLNS
jgi:hypothetical protein